MRHGFAKYGGSLGTSGSVAYLFSRTGVIALAPGADEERVMEIALEAGADDVVNSGDAGIEVHASLENFGAAQDALRAAGINFENAEMTMLPATEVEVDADGAATLLKLLDHLEDLDDVQNVWCNASVKTD